MMTTVLAKIFRFLQRCSQRDIYNRYRCKYDLHPSVGLNAIDIDFYGNGRIIIKKNTYFGNRCSIQVHEKGKVEIGENCAISHNVRIYTTNRNAKSITQPNFAHKPYLSGDVKIGDNVWVGANVIILEGSTIGNNVVIGANSKIKGHVPDYSLIK